MDKKFHQLRINSVKDLLKRSEGILVGEHSAADKVYHLGWIDGLRLAVEILDPENEKGSSR